MRTPRVITVLAAVAALALSFAPFLDVPVDARSLGQFSSDQSAAFWFGRAAILLLVVTAAASFRSLALGSGCAVLAVLAAGAPATVSSMRGAVPQGWVSFTDAPPPHLPTVYAVPMWGLGFLLAVATFTAATLLVALTRSPGRSTVVVGAFGLIAFAASLAVIHSEVRPTLGGPRRYADYLPTFSGSSFGDASRWFAVGAVVLILLAAVAARSRRMLSAVRPSRSSR